MKIRTRLLITSIFLFAMGSYWLVEWMRQDFRYHYFMTMEESMVDTATVLSSLVAQEAASSSSLADDDFRQALSDATSRTLEAEIYTFTKTNVNLHILITDETGLVLLDTKNGEAEGQDHSEWRDVRLTLNGKYGARATTSDKNDPDSLTFYVTSPILIDDEIIGTLSVGKPISSILPFMRKAKSRLVVTGITAVSAVLLLQVLISFWVTWPIRTLITYAREIRDGKKTPRPELNKSEMGDLATAFEEMRDALEGREYVEQYVQTLTHEMKSPLSAIHGASELLNEEMDKDQRQRFLHNIQSETGRMQELIERLLRLASLEKRKEIENAESIDIPLFVEEIIGSIQPIAQKKSVQILSVIEEQPQLTGEKFLIRQALINLLQNAIEFSPKDGRIHLSVVEDENRVVFHIHDDGPGIPDYALNRIFERFYSLPRPNNERKSSGLGLNFVREVALLHRGTITVTNDENGGTEAVLSLPTNR